MKLAQVERFFELQQVVEHLRDHLGVAHTVYHWVDGSAGPFGCWTYSAQWMKRYLEQNYLRVDPVVTGCFQRFHPVDWKSLDWSSRAARAYLKEAISFGVGHQGFSVPIRGPNGQFAHFSVSSSLDDAAWSAFTKAHTENLILIAHAFNKKVLELEAGRIPKVKRALSPREIDVMTLLAKGYNRAQIGKSLSISEHTIRAYIESARFKLDALNTTHAVAQAMSRGLIVV